MLEPDPRPFEEGMPVPAGGAARPEPMPPEPAPPQGEPPPAEVPERDGRPLVKVRGLTKHFPLRSTLLARTLAGARDRKVHAVDAVDLEIYPRETLGLVGESGCGKSTLGRTVVGLYPPTAGQVWFDARPLWGRGSLKSRTLRREAQIVFQNPYSSLNPRHTVRQILGVALAQRGVPLADREAETIALLRRVGLNERHIDQYPHQFSGGQRQRIGVARALAMHPRFVVADEPLSSLDVSVQAQIVNLLQDLQAELGLAYLFIAHDLSVVFHVSHRVAVMYLGRVVETAPTAELFGNPLHPYTQALLSAIPSVDRRHRRRRIILEGTVPTPIEPPPGCRFHTRCPRRHSGCDVEVPALITVAGRGPSAHRVACHLYGPATDSAKPGPAPQRRPVAGDGAGDGCAGAVAVRRERTRGPGRAGDGRVDAEGTGGCTLREVLCFEAADRCDGFLRPR